ncbi:hypothetical protein E3T35_06135 [Cryobacterium sp. TMT1-2-2]|uniref:hypothetical protein n=1 Tax=Cryobacterium sp. TMT1-2-2 TaxID=1259233 RepID=UPI00106BE4C8|nr:hypothetical protein [Cryobacterium sp. TMT1-2-2]TFD12864.1 hypothetical protein E3T35_06135 [Cryobacterium sp. TMT1-2-2]
MRAIPESVDNTAATVPKDSESGELIRHLRVDARAGRVFDMATGVTDLDLRRRVSHHGLPRLSAEALRECLTDGQLSPDPRGVHIRGVEIYGDLDLSHCVFDFPLRFTGVRFTGDLHLKNFQAPEFGLHSASVLNISAQNTIIAHDFMMINCRIGGRVSLVRAKAASMDLSHSQYFALPTSECGLDFSLASVDGDVVMDESHFVGSVNGSGADIRGSLQLSKCTIAMGGSATKTQIGLQLEAIEVGDSVVGERMKVAGSLRMHGARIGSQISLRGSRFECLDSLDPATPMRYPIFLSDTKVSGGIFLRAIVGATLNIDSASTGYLEIDQCDLESVDASDCNIAGNIDLDGAQVGAGLSLRGAFVGGDIVVPADSGKQANLGHFNLAAAEVRRDIQLDTALVTKVELTSAKIAGILLIAEIQPATEQSKKKLVDARGATIERLALNSGLSGVTYDFTDANLGTLEVEDVGLDADGVAKIPKFSLTESISVRSIAGDLGSRVALVEGWLDAGPNEPFHSQPWFEFANAYDRAGRFADARHLRYVATDKLLFRQNWLVKFVWRPLTKLTIGHGYYSFRALVGLALCFVVAWGLVDLNREAFNPTERSVAVVARDAIEHVTTAETAPTPVAYPELIPHLYALDVVLSPLGAGQSSAWWVSGTEWLSNSLMAVKLMSWLLLGLFITGVSGLISKK